jgi:hypothetical protein
MVEPSEPKDRAFPAPQDIGHLRASSRTNRTLPIGARKPPTHYVSHTRCISHHYIRNKLPLSYLGAERRIARLNKLSQLAHTQRPTPERDAQGRASASQRRAPYGPPVACWAWAEPTPPHHQWSTIATRSRQHAGRAPSRDTERRHGTATLPALSEPGPSRSPSR